MTSFQSNSRNTRFPARTTSIAAGSRSAAMLADAVIVNSAVTRHSFLPFLERAGRNPPVLVAPFGVDFPAGRARIAWSETALFRLHRHDRGSQEPSAAAQCLAPSRRRPRRGGPGSRADRAARLGDRKRNRHARRSPAFRGLVFERSNLPDAQMMRAARRRPSAAAPILCRRVRLSADRGAGAGCSRPLQQLAALRENGGDVPEYSNPLDGSVGGRR